MKKSLTGGSNYSAPAIDRMLDIVEFLATKEVPYGVSELSRTLDISSNSIFRIMARLVARGYAVQDEITKGYSLTPRLFMLRSFRQDRETLRDIAHSHIEALSRMVGETAQIQIPAGNCMESLDIIEPDCDFYLRFKPHARLHYHCNAFGKAVLAFMSNEDVLSLLPAELPRLTENTITTLAELLEELEDIRMSGISFDREEYSRGVYCIGAAVFDANGNAVAGIGITGMRVRFDQERIKDYICMVFNTAKNISMQLGYSGDYYEKIIKTGKVKRLLQEN
ncbi:MAG: IclR family transcriptional regulator [Sedimentisphaeraceae bacterium JB056]